MPADDDERPDLLVLGGGPGGCAAAITAARTGLSVLLLEPSATLGGHNANGVFAFDVGDPAGLGPIARQVAEVVRVQLAELGLAQDPVVLRREDQVWSSGVAASAWAQLCRSEPTLTVRTGAVPVGADVEGRTIRRVTWERAINPSGDPPRVEPPAAERHHVTPALVIDSTYEGDLLAWTGVRHRLGREARSRREPHAGRIYTSDARPGPWGIPPQSVLPGSTGDADDAIMAFACRLHCRWYEDTGPGAAHRVAAPSAAYDPSSFRWEPQGTGDDGPVWFSGIAVVVGDKVVLSRAVAGNEVSAPARDYVLAHPRDRARYRQQVVDHALDFLYFIQNDGGCPQLGLADDEFLDNQHLPYRVYAREGRRMEAAPMLTEHDLSPFLSGDGTRPARQPEAVAIGDWPTESRACADRLEKGYSFPEGWFFDRFSRAPFQVPYGCMVPAELDNLLVCGAVSASHLAAAATRVESTRIGLGTAAGLAAATCVSRRQNPADLSVPALQDALLRAGCPLTFFADVAPDHPYAVAVQRSALRGWVPVDEEWRFQPDRQVTWAELAQAVTTVWDVAVSVTGRHFEHVGRRHPAFVAVESLYDLGTRAGFDLFGYGALARERPVPDLLRAADHGRRLPFDPDAPVKVGEATALLRQVWSLACGGAPRGAVQVEAAARYLTRAELAAALTQHLDKDLSAR